MNGAGLLGYFQVKLKARLIECVFHRQTGYRGVVGVVTQMAQHKGVEIPFNAAGDEGGGHVVGEMTVAAHHALLYAPRIGAYLQHLQVVVRFQQQEMAALEVVLHGFRHVAEVSQQAKAVAFGLDNEAHGIGGVVGNGKAADVEVANGEAIPGCDHLNGGSAGAPVNGLMGAFIEVDRQGLAGVRLMVAHQTDEAGDVVTVLMADDDGIQRGRIDLRLREAFVQRAPADARVKQHALAGGGNQRGVAATAAGENGYLNDDGVSVGMGRSTQL